MTGGRYKATFTWRAEKIPYRELCEHFELEAMQPFMATMRESKGEWYDQ